MSPYPSIPSHNSIPVSDTCLLRRTADSGQWTARLPAAIYLHYVVLRTTREINTTELLLAIPGQWRDADGTMEFA